MNSKSFFLACGKRLALFVLLLLVSLQPLRAQTEPAAASPETQVATNSQEFLRVSLLLQEQLHATQVAIERNRLEAEAAATRSAESLAAQLSSIQQTWERQRADDLSTVRNSMAATQDSNRLILTLAAGFAGVALVAFLLTAFVQWRTAHRLGEIVTTLPMRALGAGRAVAALGAGESLASLDAAQQSNARMIGVVERLENRIGELENLISGRATDPSTATARSDTQVNVLLGKGQSLLSLGQVEEALASFDEALQLDANHAETLIKRGTALEKLDRLEEALASYDRAIAADSSMALAHLHKGSLFNRMARFNEALACYEQALKTQGKARAA